MYLKNAPLKAPVFHTPVNMPSLSLTRSDIAGRISREIGVSKTESADLLGSMISHISNSLIAGEPVKLMGFGSFSTRDKRERPGQNPKTGQPAKIEARRVLLFKSSNMLKERVNHSHKT